MRISGNMYTSIIYSINLVILFVCNAAAQQPFVVNYNPEVYNASPRNWDFAQDSYGTLFVANDDGVLIYDGRNWETIPVNGRAVRTVEYSPVLGLLVGTINDFCKIEIDSAGVYKAKSLLHLLDDKYKPINTIFNILILDDSLAFIETQKTIFKYDGKSITAYPFEEYITNTSIANNQFFVIGDEHLFRYSDDSFELIRDVLIKSGERLLFLFNDPDKNYVGGFDYKHVLKFPKGLIGNTVDWNSSFSSFLRDKKTYLITTSEPKYPYRFFPSIDNGLFVTDQSGNFIYHATREKDGILSNKVLHVFIDIEKNVWLATNLGISKLNFNLPFKRYDEKNGLVPPFHYSLEHNNYIYVASDVGLYYMKKGDHQFNLIKNASSQFWQIVPYGDGVLAAGGNEGVFYIEKGKVVKQFKTETGTMSLSVSTSSQNYIFLGLYDGFNILSFKNNTFSLVKKFDIQADVRSILEDAEGRIWIGTKFDGLFRIDFRNNEFSEPIKYTTKNGFSSLEHNHVFGSPRNTIFSSREYLYKYSVQADSFIKLSYPDVPRTQLYPWLQNDGIGNIWSLSSRFIFNSKQPFNSDSTSLLFFKANLKSVIPSSKSSYWLSTSEAIYDLMLPLTLPAPAGDLRLKTIVSYPDNEPIPFKVINDTLYQIELTEKQHSIRVAFSFPTIIQEKQVQFRSRLKQVDANWSPWTKHASKIFSELPFGSFHIDAEAISGTGKFSKPIHVSIKRTAPWYANSYAYTSYFLLLVGLITLIIYIRSNQILKRNQYLEELIAQRTDEISKQNKQLKELANEMAGANQLKSKLLQMAVHDLRNPLSVLTGYSDILVEEIKDHDKSLILKSMQRVIDKMLNSIETLLIVDEKGTLKESKERKLLDFRGIVLDVITDNSVLASRKKQSIESELEANCYVMGDRYQLTEIIENLINNAIKYSPMGSKILVKLGLKGTNGHRSVLFSVKDYGPGVEKEDHQKIFAAYTRTENNPTGGEASSGLGLNIVREIANWHNGKVWVESNPCEEKGSTFYFEMPYSE